jgi:hypothetical protein
MALAAAGCPSHPQVEGWWTAPLMSRFVVGLWVPAFVTLVLGWW